MSQQTTNYKEKILKHQQENSCPYFSLMLTGNTICLLQVEETQDLPPF